MTEALRHEIVQLHQSGMSMRAIAGRLGISRGAVSRALARVQSQRDGETATVPKPRNRGSIIDPYESVLKELLAKYPNLTVERALQELQARGFAGKYTVVRQRMRLLRPRSAPAPVPRFETEPGMQAQMDYGVYDIDFVREGRRRVYLFSYLLGYSRRHYLRFVESMDLPTTLQQHTRAFRYLGGAARICLYDNFKAVVARHDADGVFYTPRFLAFGPQACRLRRPQTKGKVERQFAYVESSLLNGRTFDTLDHLNEVTAWWLENVADVRTLRDFKESPRERHGHEQPHLLPLPASDFDTAQVLYRHVNVEGFITHRQNAYSVPFAHIGQVLPVRITEEEVIIYSIALEEIARHALLSGTQTGVRQKHKDHHRTSDPGKREQLLRQRFEDFGPVAVQFFEGLQAAQTQGKLQAQQLLAFITQYQRDDVHRAFERAVRFGAFSVAAVRRILAAQAKPKQWPDELIDLQRDALDPSLRGEVIGPRPTSAYQHLLTDEDTDDDSASEEDTSRRQKSDDEPA